MAENGKTTGGHDPSDRESSASSGVNTFANDGSFLAMFQKKMEEQKKLKEDAERRQDAGEDDTAATDPTCSGTSLTTPPPDGKLPATKKGFLLPIRTSPTSGAVDAGSRRPWSQVGKRKGPILKTGVVKKKKPSGDKYFLLGLQSCIPLPTQGLCSISQWDKCPGSLCTHLTLGRWQSEISKQMYE
ncbi:Hypp7038 [Branchiostoma lanceolatum]|uniref:Hypp7038 protein n=1 Tax=Branchiostoma lanceolatum TaxID=7740 RepID=A0A8J9YWR6_BRALA|nr:Hypp7038 [Branchiostoma lanceolatum]